MSGHQWQAIAKILEIVESLPTGEQTRYLEEHCDSIMRREVLSLLNADLKEVAFLNKPIFSDPILIGQQIGGFTILRELAKGGMGTVFLAKQDDPERDVALKFLANPLSGSEANLRFKFEQAVLARLNHSFIAKIFDCGTTDRGFPYFAMEYIDGLQITDYCDAHRLSIKQRLALFSKVCLGISHAHSKGVMHRDIKPSNILIASENGVPIPKIIDFGIARPLDVSSELTHQGIAPGTLRYMSPEQAACAVEPGLVQDLDVKTDVYGLGALLYELLLGVPPLSWPRGTSLASIYQLIRTSPPQKPSLRWHGELPSQRQIAQQRNTTPKGMALVFKGDLDWVIMKALEKEPKRRYLSPEQFRADLQRHSVGLPVIAGPPTLSYRLGKFLSRHKLAVMTSLASILLILSFALAMFFKNQTIVRERNLAQLERDKASMEAASVKHVTNFLIEMFQVNDPFDEQNKTPNKDISAKELLAVGMDRLEKDLHGQPKVQARLMVALGLIYQRLGHFEKSQSMLEKALTLRQSHFHASHPEVLECLNELAKLFFEKGDLIRSEALFRKVLTLQEGSLNKDDLHLATTLNSLANLLREKGQYSEAEKLFLRTLAVYQQHGQDSSLALGETHNELAILYLERGQYSQSENHHRIALDIHLKQLGEHHPGVATQLNNLALVLHNMGKVEEAESLYLQSWHIRRQTLPTDHPDIATILNNLGLFYHREGKFEQAEPFYCQALDIRRRIYEPSHPLLATSLNNLAGLYYQTQRFQAAKPLFSEALQHRRSKLGPEHPLIAQSMQNLGLIYQAEKRYTEAMPLYRDALAMRRRIFANQHPAIAANLYSMAELHTEQDQFQLAEALIQEAIPIYEKFFDANHVRLGKAKSLLGFCLLKQSRYGEAEVFLNESFQILSHHEAKQIKAFNRVLHRLVLLYSEWGDSEKALLYKTKLTNHQTANL